MNRITARTFSAGCALTLLSAFAFTLSAQTTHQIDVKRGKVIYVSGNDLIVRTEDDLLRHVVVPSDFKFDVDGKQITIHELKPGTELTQVITSTTEEKIITNVRAIDAKVIEAKPPYVTLSEGDKIRHIKVPEGTTFTIDGKELKLSELREGMKLKGTVVASTPTTVMSRSRTVSGKTPKTVDTPTLLGVLLIEETDAP